MPNLFYKINKFNNNDVCKDIINYYINNFNNSYPINKSSYCIDISKYSDINFTTFLGNSLDVLSGLLYISFNYKSVKTSLTHNFFDNKIIQNYYDSIGIDYKYEFLNFEILWSFQKIFFPSILNDLVKKFLKSNNRFLIIPIGIELNIGSHANMLIYDKKFNEVERFEPNGNNNNNFLTITNY